MERGGRDKGRDKDLSFSWPLSVKPKDVNYTPHPPSNIITMGKN